jgi:hypothetical protein
MNDIATTIESCKRRVLIIANLLLAAAQSQHRDADADAITSAVFAVLACEITKILTTQFGHAEEDIWPTIEEVLEAARHELAASWQSMPLASLALN